MRFENIPELENIHNVFSKVIIYQAKLSQLKKDINSINERIGKLKKRSVSLQQKKISLELSQADKIDKVLQKEKELMARPAKSLSSPSNIPLPLSPPPANINNANTNANTTNVTIITNTTSNPPEHKEKVKATPVILPPAPSSRR